MIPSWGGKPHKLLNFINETFSLRNFFESIHFARLQVLKTAGQKPYQDNDFFILNPNKIFKLSFIIIIKIYKHMETSLIL